MGKAWALLESGLRASAVTCRIGTRRFDAQPHRISVMTDTIAIRLLQRSDREQWLPLWEGYNAF